MILATQKLTLLDHARRLDPNGKIAKIVEIMNETNEILDDMVYIEGNLATGHKTTIRSGLPAVAWRMLNYGIQPSKSRTVQVQDSCGMLEAYSVIDVELAALNGNTADFRLSEDRAYLESMSQTLAETVIYGNTDENPERFLGLAPRYSDPSAENGMNILDGGSVGTDNTSIYLVCWGEQTCHGIYPKGSKAGVQHKDLGEDTVSDGNGGEYQALRSHYQAKAGLTLRDWRYVVRIANIDVTALKKDASSGADLIDLMVQAIELLPAMGMGRCAFYCNRTIRSFLRRQITNKNNVWLSMDEIAGKKALAFDSIPVRRVDKILNTEDLLTF